MPRSGPVLCRQPSHQPLWASHGHVLNPLDFAPFEFCPRIAIEKRRHCGFRFETRERRPQAEMSRPAERKVPIRGSSNIKSIRFAELCAIPVRGTDHHQDRLARGNEASAISTSSRTRRGTIWIGLSPILW
jgi:hypothetical protein